MAKAENAAFSLKATSGLQRENFTVNGSTAAISFRIPPYPQSEALTLFVPSQIALYSGAAS